MQNLNVQMSASIIVLAEVAVNISKMRASKIVVSEPVCAPQGCANILPKLVACETYPEPNPKISFESEKSE